ncbi:Lysophospholipid acyltransferase 5 [Oopsacas minuta]|uniref:Lysophospholipid acyltransferase 5 n=1 Tax=Oopsacas minuta TaxID=111878 RepID=A0AAV7JUV6_9METZ|nr:Lysophospholipid acyltransferase 5 [Oopsacas minuta]
MDVLRAYDPAKFVVNAVGINETSARIFISISVAFLLSFLYRPIISKQPSIPQHIINAVIGSSLLYYCFGNEVLHLVFDVVIVIFILKTIGGTFISLISTWIIVFGHLLYGYYNIITSNNVARLDWTIPGCVLCLKLIGLISDLYDTVQANKRGETNPKKIPLKSNRIGVFEVIGYSTCFTTCIVSPVISFQRYVDFSNGTLFDTETIPNSMGYGIMRFSIGLLFVSIYSLLLPYVPIDYFASAEFVAKPFVYKFFLAALRYKVIFKQYSSIWLLSEGACVVTGLSYKGKNKDGSIDWSGCAGIHVIELETAIYMQQIINSFNLTTNEWVLQHVYKKCRFLNSKIASQSISLLFLAAFHGFLPGYFICFAHEIIVVIVEKQFMDYGTMKLGPFSSWPLILRIISIPFLFLYQLFGMTLTVGVFQLLTLERCLTFMGALHYYTIYAYIILVPIGKYLEIQVKKEKKQNLTEREKHE